MSLNSSPAASPTSAGFKPEARSRVTNGKQLFLGAVDGRSREARRWRDLYHSFLNQTGNKHDQMVRSLASLVLRREQLDARIAVGEDIDTDLLLRLCGTINRTMAKLGIVADDEDEGVDVTEQVIAHIHAQAEALP